MPDHEPLPIRPFRAGDEPALVDMFARVFGRAIDESHWRWKLLHPDAGVGNVLLATSNELPVFQYAGIPTRFAIDGAPAQGMVSVDTMTAPEFRRRGLLTRVAAEAYAQWRANGADFVIGLPNEQWGSRAAALGWVPLFKLQRMILPLRPEALLAKRLSLPWLGRLGAFSWLWRQLALRMPARAARTETRPVTTAGEEFDRLWEASRGNARHAVIRDQRWVQWRFLSCPSRRYHVRLASRDGAPRGYLAYQVADDAGRCRAFIAEMQLADADETVADTLFADLLAEMQALRAEFVATLAVPGTRWHQWLRRRGFFGGAEFSVEMVPLSARISADRLRNAADWELSGAAFDVI